MDGRIANFGQIASVRRYAFTEGAERGLRVLDCDNGKIRFLLNESKALDVMQLYHEGQNISFLSKNGFTARETPFLSRFEGGMLYTCGLDSVGGREGFELHGTHHNTPARVTRAECGEAGILIEAEVRETALFGKNLLFKRRVFAAIGSDTLEITDTLQNLGASDEAYCLLYHVNVGYPMLDENAILMDDAAEVIPRTPWAAEHLDTRAKFTQAVAGQEEMCYFLKCKTPRVTVQNQKLGKSFTLEWSGDTLPQFVEWKSMSAGDYALGLEPSTTMLDESFVYRNIAAAECIQFSLKLAVRK